MNRKLHNRMQIQTFVENGSRKTFFMAFGSYGWRKKKHGLQSMIIYYDMKRRKKIKKYIKKIVKGHSLPFYPWSADSCHNGMPFFVVKHGTSDIHIVLYDSTHHSIPGSIIRVSPWLCPFHVKSIKFIHYIYLKIAPQAHEHYVTLNISLNTSRIAMWNRNAVSRCRLYVCLKYNWNGSWIFCVTKVITRTGRPLMFRRCRTRISKGYDEAIVPWVTADAGSLK